VDKVVRSVGSVGHATFGHSAIGTNPKMNHSQWRFRNDRTAKGAKREYKRSTHRPTKRPAVSSANIAVSSGHGQKLRSGIWLVQRDAHVYVGHPGWEPPAR
jgi:hypothetical protein